MRQHSRGTVVITFHKTQLTGLMKGKNYAWTNHFFAQVSVTIQHASDNTQGLSQSGRYLLVL